MTMYCVGREGVILSAYLCYWIACSTGHCIQGRYSAAEISAISASKFIFTSDNYARDIHTVGIKARDILRHFSAFSVSYRCSQGVQVCSFLVPVVFRWLPYPWFSLLKTICSRRLHSLPLGFLTRATAHDHYTHDVDDVQGATD